MIKKITLKNIRTDGSTQQRPIDEAVLKRYMGLMKDGFEFPPVSVIFDGKEHWLWDGFHRYHALRKLGKPSINASVENGKRREAIWFSFQANKDHGFPRQKDTVKKMLLEKVFPDKEWGGLTDETIAQWVGVTNSYVSRIRKQQSAKSDHRSDSGQGQLRSAYQAKKADSGKKKGSGKKDSNSPGSKKVLDSVGETVPKNLRNVFSRVN